MIDNRSKTCPSVDDDDDDGYTSAVTALYSTEHQATTREALQRASARRTRTVTDMHAYMQRIGLLERCEGEKDAISVIHVAGTKGKGSVCAMCESIVRSTPGVITGLFTSPHLVDIRERIRINGQPVSKRVFGQAYWNIRARLEQYHSISQSCKIDDYDDDLPILPGYFRMITLLALYIFRHYISDDGRRISCIILEVGMGGRYDATNVHLPWSEINTVCGITLIDYDHVRVLGHSLPEIAWEKGGIYKVHKECDDKRTPHPAREKDTFLAAIGRLDSTNPSSPHVPRCFALDTNDSAVIDVFRLCANIEGEGYDLQLIGPYHNPQLPPDCLLGLKGSHQRANAELAVALCRALWEIQRREKHFKEDPNTNLSMEAIVLALANVSWPARCQTVVYQDVESTIPVTVRLDGAHTEQSVRAGLAWFQALAPVTRENTCRILIFNCSHERNPLSLLQLLYSLEFHAVYFCQANSERPSAEKKALAEDIWKSSGKELPADFNAGHDISYIPSWQETLLELWNLMDHDDGTKPGCASRRALDRAANLTAADALERGLRFGRTVEGVADIEFFCTGSLYLVGSMLSALQWQEQETTGTLDE